MLKIVSFLSFGLLFLIAYYYYSKIRAGRFILKKTLVGKIARKIAPKENSKERLKIQDRLNKALSNLDIVDITAMKTLSIISTIVLAIAIFITNTSIKQEKIYNTATFNISVISNNNNAVARKNNVKIIKKYTSLKNINDNIESLDYIKKILKEKGSISNAELNQTANITMSDIVKINQMYSITSMLVYLLIAVSGMWIFDIILFIYLNTRKNHINMEANKLMNILTLVLSTATMPTQRVITMLIDSSDYLKEILQKFFISYMVNSEEAYKLYLVKTGNKSFEKLVGMLKQIEDSDKEEAIRNIRNQNENQKALKRLEFENIMQKKDGIALVILTVGVMFMIKYIMDFSMLAMNSAGSMNF